MAKLIAKNGRLQALNGRLITDANGAPCCCGGGSCWILAMPCNCDCPGPLYVFENTPELEAAWPYSDRVGGVVAQIAIDGGDFTCVEHIGSTTTLPQGSTITSAGAIIELFPACSSSPCSEIPPCAGTLGNGFTVDSFGLPDGSDSLCIPNGWTTGCLQTAIVTVNVSGHRAFVDTVGGGFESEQNLSMTAIYRYDLAGNGQRTLTDWSVVSSASGFERFGGNPSADTQWNVTAEYSPNDGSGFSISENQETLGLGINVLMTASDSAPVSPGTSMSISADQGGVDCNGTSEVDDPDVGVWSETRRFNAKRLSGSRSVFADNLWYGQSQSIDTHETGSTNKRVSYRFITTDGVTIEDDECAITALVARRCGQFDASIVFDPADRPPEGNTMIFEGERYYPTLEPSQDIPVSVQWEPDVCHVSTTLLATLCSDDTISIPFDDTKRPPDGVTVIFNGESYRPTTTPSQDDPFDVTWSPDSCPQQWYKAVACGSNTPNVAEGFRYQSSAPTTDGYVLILNQPFPLIGPNCTITFAVRPTTELADMTEVIGFHQLNRTCNQIPSVSSGCLGDPGGPDDRPEFPGQLLSGSGRFGSDATLDAAGFDLPTEQRIQRNGGCCGQPSG